MWYSFSIVFLHLWSSCPGAELGLNNGIFNCVFVSLSLSLGFPQLTRRAPTPCTPPTRAMRSCSTCPPCCPTCPTTPSRWDQHTARSTTAQPRHLYAYKIGFSLPLQLPFYLCCLVNPTGVVTEVRKLFQIPKGYSGWRGHCQSLTNPLAVRLSVTVECHSSESEDTWRTETGRVNYFVFVSVVLL